MTHYVIENPPIVSDRQTAGRHSLRLELHHSVDRELAARLIREARRINRISQWRTPSWALALDTAATLALAECAVARDADEEGLAAVYDHIAGVLEAIARRRRH